MTSQVSSITRKTTFSPISWQLTCFPRLNKKMLKQKIKNIKLHLFHCKKSTQSKIITITNNFVGHKNSVDTCDIKIQLYWECTLYLLYLIIYLVLQQPLIIIMEGISYSCSIIRYERYCERIYEDNLILSWPNLF